MEQQTFKIDLTKPSQTIGSINLPNVPNNSSGGSVGDLYVDSNSFLKVVSGGG